MNAGNITSLKVVQVSDCHVSSDPDDDYRGFRAGRMLESLLPALRQFQPDLLLLTGDVSEDASPESYGRVSAMMCSIGAPVLALPGNHDVPETMARFFPNGPWGGPKFHSEKGWQLVLLDSTRPNEIAGRFPEGQLDGLREGLARSEAAHILVALHHQPVEVGSPWIDKYALQEPKSLLDIIEQDSRVRCVTWGHVHQEFSATLGGVHLLGSPSTVANSIPGREKFTPDATGPACRWLVLGSGGSVETGLLRA